MTTCVKNDTECKNLHLCHLWHMLLVSFKDELLDQMCQKNMLSFKRLIGRYLHFEPSSFTWYHRPFHPRSISYENINVKSVCGYIEKDFKLLISVDTLALLFPLFGKSVRSGRYERQTVSLRWERVTSPRIHECSILYWIFTISSISKLSNMFFSKT